MTKNGAVMDNKFEQKKEKRYLKENNVFEGGWMNVRRPAAKCTFMMLTSKTYLKIMKWFIRSRIPKILHYRAIAITCFLNISEV